MLNKTALCALIGAIGGALASAFGGWDAAMITLVSFMGLDYVTGLIVAGVFRKSTKSASGALESRAGWKGILRKFATLIVVFIAVQMDVLLNTDFVRDAAVIAFAVNEALSILENVALMGVPIPSIVLNALDVLKKENDKTGTQKTAGTAVESADRKPD